MRGQSPHSTANHRPIFGHTFQFIPSFPKRFKWIIYTIKTTVSMYKTYSLYNEKNICSIIEYQTNAYTYKNYSDT